MAKRRSKETPPSTAGGRVRHLLKAHWHGNQSRMARDVGCAASSLSRVESGREPGKRLLAQVASHPQVNAEWLFEGQGEPLVGAVEPPPSTPSSLPVVFEPLPGPPGDHGVRLGDTGFSIVAQHRTTRYWLELAGTASILKHPEAGLLSGDLLLIETDLRDFEDPVALSNHICVAWVSDVRAKKRRLELGIAAYFEGPDEADFQLHTGELHYHRWDGLTHVGAHAVRKDEVTGEAIDLGPVEVAARRDKQGALNQIPVHGYAPVVYQIGEVVGVCVGMFRRRCLVFAD